MAGITSLGYDNASMLLGSLSSSSTTTSIYDNIGNYKSIVNGSYGKLLTAYYQKTGKTVEKEDTSKKTTTKIEDQSKVLSSIKTKSDKLTTTAAELATTGSKSLFKDKDGNTDKAVEKIKELVTDYNNLITEAKKSTDSRTNSRVSAMISNTNDYESKLSNIGITVKDDNTLSINDDKLKSASMADLKELFNGSRSFASAITQRAARVGAQAAISSATSSTYTSRGSYNNVNVQNLYNGIV